MHAAGFKWLALNVGDGHRWDDWRPVIDRARALNVVVMPWARCRTLTQCWDLLDEADLVSFQAILNVEDEFKQEVDPGLLAGVITDFPDLKVGISTVAWLYNDVDYSPLAGYPVLLQIFPADNGWDPSELEQKTKDCVAHARDKGFTYVGATVQTYAGAEPGWYGYLSGAKSLYTGDDVGAGNWEAWK